MLSPPLAASLRHLTQTSTIIFGELPRSMVFHPVGTAAMSSSSSKSGFVDENFLVKGADGLRIVDASVFVSDVELKIENRFTPFNSPSFLAPIHEARFISLMRGLLISSRYHVGITLIFSHMVLNKLLTFPLIGIRLTMRESPIIYSN